MSEDGSSSASTIRTFIRDTIGARRDQQGGIGKFCRYIRPGLVKDTIFTTFVSPADATGPGSLWLDQAVAWCQHSTVEHHDFALIAYFQREGDVTDIATLDVIEHLFALKPEFERRVAEAGMTGALVFRRPGAVADGREGLAPEIPFWVLRFIVAEDRALAKANDALAAAYQDRFGR